MDRPGQVRREVKAEAAAWLARLRADDRSPADEHCFRTWVAEDLAHAEAFDAVTTMWDALGALPRDLRGRRQAGKSHVGRRTVLAGLSLGVVAAGSFSVWRSAQARVYETETGEQKHVTLSDGSQALLDTNTKFTVDFSETQRLADLQYGRVNFRISPDSARPFAVKVGDELVVVNHSVFDVRRDGDRVSIILIQGNAEVKNAAAGAKRALKHGERLVALPGNKDSWDKPNLEPLLAWQTGQAIFENNTLAQAVYEMNRYSNVKLSIADPAIASLQVSGVYRVGDNVTFANSVAKLLPIEVRSQNDHIELIADTTRTNQG